MKMLKNLLFAFALGALAVCAVYADINKDLLDSAENGDANKVKSLIKQGANVNAKNDGGWTALMWASDKGHFEIVKYLVKGADINAKQNNGFTALMLASQSGHFEIVKFLVENGANVNARNEVGRTALYLAQTDKIEQYLKSKGAKE